MERQERARHFSRCDRMMFTCTAVGFAVVGYAAAFSGMAPLALKPSSTSRLALRASGNSMSIGVFYGTTTGNTESVAKRVSIDVRKRTPAGAAISWDFTALFRCNILIEVKYDSKYSCSHAACILNCGVQSMTLGYLTRSQRRSALKQLTSARASFTTVSPAPARPSSVNPGATDNGQC